MELNVFPLAFKVFLASKAYRRGIHIDAVIRGRDGETENA